MDPSWCLPPLFLSLWLWLHPKQWCFQLCLQSHLNLQIHAHISDFPLTRWLHLNVLQVPQHSMFQMKLLSPKTPKPASTWILVAPPSTPLLQSVPCAHFLLFTFHDPPHQISIWDMWLYLFTQFLGLFALIHPFCLLLLLFPPLQPILCPEVRGLHFSSG